MNLITRDTDYAVRALCYMAQRPGQMVSVTEICSQLAIPKQYLRRVLQALARHHILKSHRGKGGGFLLQKDPADILLTDLMEVFQGKMNFTRCVFRASACQNRANCPLRNKIKEIETLAAIQLHSTTIASLASESPQA